MTFFEHWKIAMINTENVLNKAQASKSKSKNLCSVSRKNKLTKKRPEIMNVIEMWFCFIEEKELSVSLKKSILVVA